MSLKATKKSNVISENRVIEIDGYTSIRLTNIGADDAVIDDNTPLKANSLPWEWKNDPGIEINQNTGIVFAGVSADKRVLVEMFYIK